jgi:hypothetical protein
MIKKYHVFISSTLDDLKAERRELAKAVAGLGHIPVFSDDFDGEGEDSSRFIKKSIRESDYFLALTAYRYGPLPPEGKGFGPEGEYLRAVKYGVPVIALMIDEKARWKDAKKEKDPAALRALEGFRRKLAAHTGAAWSNAPDLRQKARELLIREMNLNPRSGWVPGTAAVEAPLANELARLLRENEDLKLRLQEEPDQGGDLRNHMRRTLKVLALNKASLSFYYTPGENWENTKAFPYLRLFRLLAPELSPGKTIAEISHFLGKILNPDLGKTVRGNYPVPSNTVKKIMVDFAILKLVRQPGSGRGGMWVVSEYGRDLYALYRTRQLERALAKNTAAR